MKIRKLLRVVLVAEKYLVVNDGNNNRTIPVSNSNEYEIGDMYTLTDEPEIKADEKKRSFVSRFNTVSKKDVEPLPKDEEDVEDDT